MKYLPIDRALYVGNRKKFIAQMEPNSIAVFNSNDIYPISADSTMPFKQHRDILYLSGVDQEESILVLFPDAHEGHYKEVLFLKETSELIAVWEGEKLTKETAFATSGIESVFWLQDFDVQFNNMMAQAENVYINTNIHLRANKEVQTREDRFIEGLKKKYPAHSYKKAAPILHGIRSIKEQIEIDLMQQACNITSKGVQRVVDFLKPGVWEYEIEAEIMHEFLRNRSAGFAYTPIIGSGYNACVLHYIENNQQCNDGDVVLMDFGAEYANYASDLTRCFPVSGRFSQRQKDVYNAVLRVKTESETLLVPGTYLADYHKEVGKLMESELLGLGLIDKTDIKNEDPAWPAYKKYFMHGTSHYIGLDTHDVGSWTSPIQAGNVFTCEPGIYIPEENLGIRLEDDLVVQENGAPFNLMSDIPIEAEAIEDAMNG
ncbi:aminopeptidase P N-terminal domain-containing protein [Salibacteraceae bacterium]|jgi:Xaa-Pro aminopeptidase|nr:aminopeptidase P N-terminal domain-containing protein [Bacteroidota bacterium]MDA9938194.1 aminopeptidase P N-terminal domain-containing protein [Salibacteraceae bacterium]MDB9725245.1 aminopeptidase P N-terminal domain-containing protein [Salibacteraceae bacterium]